MKVLPLIAAILAALCTAGAITAYVMIGRNDEFEPLPAEARPKNITVPVPAAPGTARASLQPSAPAPEVPLLRQNPMPSVEPVTTPAGQAVVFPAGPQQSAATGSPSAQLTFPTRNHTATPTIPPSEAPRFRTSFTQSDRATAVAHEMGTREDTLTKPAEPKNEKPASPSDEASATQTPTPGKDTEFQARNAAPRKRALWPRGNFTVEEERVRAQIGWQVFADEIFDASINPPENEMMK